MTTREELEAEAAELYPESLFIQFGDRRLDPHEARFITAGKRAAHIRAKTISAEQAEEATEARLLKRGYNSRHSIPSHDFAYEVAETIEGFRAAGFYVEELA